MLIVLVAEHPNSRVAKIGYGLKSLGCDVVLLHKNPLNATCLDEYFTETHQFRDHNEALAMASSYRPVAFHVFSLNVDWTSLTFVQQRPGKVVFDAYDTCEGIAYEWAVQNKPAQRHCLEHADAVCARDLRLRWLRAEHGYRYKRALLFMDYCWNKPVPPVQKISNAEIHLVAIGYILVEKLGFPEHRYLQVAQDLAEQQVHFHLYPHATQAADVDGGFSEYHDFARRSRYLHIHHPVPFDLMTRELAQYHGGVAFTGCTIYGEQSKDYAPGYNRHCTGSRNFDYLDAGLPVLDNRNPFRFRYQLLARYGMAIDVNLRLIGEAGTALRPLLSADAQCQANQVRRIYAVQRHAPRLLAYYKSL